MDDKELEKAALDYCAKCLDITNRNVDLDKDECVDLYNSFTERRNLYGFSRTWKKDKDCA